MLAALAFLLWMLHTNEPFWPKLLFAMPSTVPLPCWVLKFFEHFELEFVMQGARALHFPMVDLVLGLHMHLADRFLQNYGCASKIVTPFRSILAGCALATSFTKALLTPHLAPVVNSSPKVDQTVHVDDFFQLATGPLHEVAGNLVVAALQFVVAARRLKLRFCKKTSLSLHNLLMKN